MGLGYLKYKTMEKGEAIDLISGLLEDEVERMKVEEPYATITIRDYEEAARIIRRLDDD